MGQDSNAANEGDQMKHALLAEVLVHCLEWPSLTYAETHAGAGIYDASSQSAGKDHIRRLRSHVHKLDGLEEADAGGGYARLLKKWWSEDGNVDKYPGSVIQAAITLMQRRESLDHVQMRVTEACGEIHKQLAKAVGSFGVNPRHVGFQNEIGWLTENECLVLLIDPFTYTNDKNGLNKGHVDLDTLTTVLANCWDKSQCVIGFWCAVSDRTGWEKRRQFDHHLLALINDARAEHRVYCAGRCNRFQLHLIGIGEGSSVISQLPFNSSWRESWLGPVIREKES
ncbi:Ribosomal RNA large subunit methyltransferase J [Symmachiella dynata]|nr:Ribosomal RNA large subunit methyltransferase J [Symmachiella dynata]